MKTIKIFAIGSHTFIDRMSGVDYIRILQPMKYLDGYSDGKVTFDITTFDPRKGITFDWRDVFNEHDIIFFNYTTNDIGYAVMGLMAQKYGKKLVCDVDDALWFIKTDNPANEIFKKGSWGLEVVTAVLKDVHYVTCTNKYLRNIISHNTGKPTNKIKVFPNEIDLELYKYRYPAKESYPIKIQWFGSSTHFIDIMSTEFVKGMDRIMKEFPNVTLNTTGAMVSKFNFMWGIRYKTSYGDPDLMKWIHNRYNELMKDTDIVVAVLGDDPYDKSRSDVKFLEYSAAKKPGVYSNTRPYQEVIKHGETGYLARYADDWYEYLKILIMDVEKRRSIGEAAFKYVQDNRTIQSKVKDYAEWFKSIMNE